MIVVVTGAASGLGRCIARRVCKDVGAVYMWDLPHVDVTEKTSIIRAAAQIDKVDVLVNCAGVNQLAKIEDIDEHTFDRHMHVNARGMLWTVQCLLPRLSGGTVCNIISNASHMPMTASLAYGASKAAAALMTKTMARELWPTYGITVFGVSPNRLAGTLMSKSVDEQVARQRNWSPAQTARNQRNALPINEETEPDVLAEFIVWLLAEKHRHKYLHGCIIPYGGPTQ